MKDKYGFKTSSLEEHINKMQIDYNNSKVVANAHRYVPSYKKPIQNNSVSDLFKDTRTQSQKSAEELQLLSNANQLDQLFNENRYAFVSSLDNAQCKEIDVQYSTKGAYFVNMKNEDVFFNKVSKIEKLDYVPACVLKKSNYMYKHTTYNIYVKHEYSNEDILVARVVFAS